MDTKSNDETTKISFEITNLYLNTPAEIAVDVIENKLENNMNPTHERSMKLLKTALYQNYFPFCSKYYKLNKGHLLSCNIPQI